MRRLFVVSALFLVVLAGCTQAPPRQANGWHFGTCSVPVVGDVQVEGAHGTRFAFREASTFTGVQFREGSYAEAALYGVTIRYMGWAAAPYAETHHWRGTTGRTKWELRFWGTPPTGLVRHEVGHIFLAPHDSDYNGVMRWDVPNRHGTWDNVERWYMRETARKSGC